MYKNPEASKKGPLLIKIEPCPKTGKAEPCSEECTKQCLEKSYTIFDPKPPRKRQKSSEAPLPVVQIIEPPKVSSYSSNLGELRESSGHHIKSPDLTSPESSKSAVISHESTAIPTSPVLSEVKVESGASVKRSQVSMKEEKPPKEKPTEETRQETECVLEILVLEKHDKKCELWTPSALEETTDWLKNYNIISHHAVKICKGQPSTQPYIPKRINQECICEKTTNVNKFSACPVCSRCPCHGKQVRAGYMSTSESEPVPPSEPFSLSNISDPDTYVESVSSASEANEYVPDFKRMAITRPTEEKKHPFLLKCFMKNKKKSGKKKAKAEKEKKDSKCPQCVVPICLDGDAMEGFAKSA